MACTRVESVSGLRQVLATFNGSCAPPATDSLNCSHERRQQVARVAAKKRRFGRTKQPVFGSAGAIGVTPVVDPYDDDLAVFLVDAVQNPVGTSSSRVDAR
jgi:hypothetical protein